MPKCIDDEYIQNDVRRRTVIVIIAHDCTYCRRRQSRHDTTDDDKDSSHGTIDKDRFSMWVEEKLVPTLGNYALGEPRSVVIMDNGTIHAGVRELIEGAGAKIQFILVPIPRNWIRLNWCLVRVFMLLLSCCCRCDHPRSSLLSLFPHHYSFLFFPSIYNNRNVQVLFKTTPRRRLLYGTH